MVLDSGLPVFVCFLFCLGCCFKAGKTCVCFLFLLFLGWNFVCLFVCSCCLRLKKQLFVCFCSYYCF